MLLGWLSLLLHTETTQRSQFATIHFSTPTNLYVGLTYLLLWPGFTSHHDLNGTSSPTAAQGSNILCTRKRAASTTILLPTHWRWWCYATGTVEVAHCQQQMLSTPAVEKPSKPERKHACSITSIWSLVMKRLIWRLEQSGNESWL